MVFRLGLDDCQLDRSLRPSFVAPQGTHNDWVAELSYRAMEDESPHFLLPIENRRNVALQAILKGGRRPSVFLRQRMP